jgi:hypothetical protein
LYSFVFVLIFLALLNPSSLQQICRFKIRDCIRWSIEKDDSTYYHVKREKSTFNPDLIKNKVGESRDGNNGESYYSDSELESVSDEEGGGGQNNYRAALSRINRFFALGPISNNNSNNNNNNNNHNNNQEASNQSESSNQLRLLVCGN